MFDYKNRWSDDPDSSLPLAKRYAEQAIEKNPNEPLARAVAAVTATFDGDLDRARSQIGVALSLNPNLAMAYNISGSIRMYAGEPLEGIALIERAMRLDPAANTQYLHFLGMANLLAGKYETAAALLKQRIALVPETDFSRSMLASALGHLGEADEARRVWSELKQINPRYSFSEHLSRLPFKRTKDAQLLADGLARAGVPD
jgi:adenylate cyclase